MEKREPAFVIKKFNSCPSKIVVLTMCEGKRDLLIKMAERKINICNGMLLSFNKTEYNGLLICQDFEILACPLNLRYDTIYFLHNILEICDHFSPYNKPCMEIFLFLSNWLIFSNKCETVEHFPLFNKIFILKLLSMFGFYPHDEIIKSLILYDKLTTSFIDFDQIQKLEFLNEHMTGICESDLNRWIIYGLQEHPKFHLFKTLAFLYKD